MNTDNKVKSFIKPNDDIVIKLTIDYDKKNLKPLEQLQSFDFGMDIINILSNNYIVK